MKTAISVRRIVWSLILLAAAGVVQPVKGTVILYSHDVAGRLNSVAYTNNKAINYSYDLAGNLLQRTVTSTSLVVVPEDSDNDGLPDAWELLYFNTLSRDGTGDYDMDGFTDLAEFQLGTNPTDSSSLLRIIPPPLVDSSGVTILWTSVSGKTYRLQYQNVLGGTWMNVAGDVLATAETAQKLDPAAVGQANRFYRVLLVVSTGNNTPAPQLLPNPLMAPGEITLQWTAVSGKTYRLQFKNSLSDSTWQEVPGDVQAGADTASKTDSTISGHQQRFYRVMLIEP